MYDFLTPESIAKWNSINPLTNIGSHSRTHQGDWPPLDILHETIQAIADQEEPVPATINYFNFSGQQNPTRTQMEQLYATRTVFGANGTGFMGRGCSAFSRCDRTHRLYIQRIRGAMVTRQRIAGGRRVPVRRRYHAGRNGCPELDFGRDIMASLAVPRPASASRTPFGILVNDRVFTKVGFEMVERESR